MRKIDKLKREARDLAEMKGHELAKFATFEAGFMAKCKWCNCTAIVYPPDFSIPDGEIAGTATRLPCYNEMSMPEMQNEYLN
jgi:hypothetical protein